MSNMIEEVNKLMAKIHELHKQYDDSKEDFSTNYVEFDDENTQSFVLLHKVEELLCENAQETLEYLKQCSAQDFYIVMAKTELFFKDRKAYPVLKEIWERYRPKKFNRDYEDVMECIIHAESYADAVNQLGDDF